MKKGSGYNFHLTIEVKDSSKLPLRGFGLTTLLQS
jgi:hypothetical protein